MDELLRMEHISYQYDNSYMALNNVSATFYAGELVAILGSNGAGKSTFFLCCNGVLRPQSGRIFYNGREISSKKNDIYALRQAVGLVFQDPDSQIIAGTVQSEVSFGPMNLRLPQGEVSRRVEKSLAQMDIIKHQDRAPHHLSGGEKKRVSIADILAMEPAIILLDEPTASLDPQNMDALEQILIELNRAGITIIISTHDVDFAYRIAKRIIVFAQGAIVADAKVDEAFTQESMLEKAGLKKPLIYEAFELVQITFPSLNNLQNNQKPRTIEEFHALLSKFHEF